LLKNGQKTNYLSVIIDGATKEVIAQKISNKNDYNLVKKTLLSAIKKYPNIKNQGLIIHSDQGSQYTSKNY
jgi:transposase InsO family protein